MKRLQRKHVEVDPFFQETPWEIVRDGQGKVIGEVFLLPVKKENGGKQNDRPNKRIVSEGYTR